MKQDRSEETQSVPFELQPLAEDEKHHHVEHNVPDGVQVMKESVGQELPPHPWLEQRFGQSQNLRMSNGLQAVVRKEHADQEHPHIDDDQDGRHAAWWFSSLIPRRSSVASTGRVTI